MTYNVRQRQSCHSERDRDSVVTVASNPCSLFDVFAVFSPPPLTATRSPAVYSWSLLLAAPARGPTRRPLFQRGNSKRGGVGCGEQSIRGKGFGVHKGGINPRGGKHPVLPWCPVSLTPFRLLFVSLKTLPEHTWTSRVHLPVTTANTRKRVRDVGVSSVQHIGQGYMPGAYPSL